MIFIDVEDEDEELVLLGVLGVVLGVFGDGEVGGRMVLRKGFFEFWKVILGWNLGILLEILLFFILRVIRFGKVVSWLGIDLVRVLLFRRIDFNVVMFVKYGEMVFVKLEDVREMLIILVLEYFMLIYLYGFVLV